uniref:Uncharacterized protein n=1 Tax=Avena sativa TaxID=4498 RepID=A0ACD5Z302_AVESA
MASTGGQMKMVVAVVVGMTTVAMLIAAGATTTTLGLGSAEICVNCLEDVPGPNACICSKNCACAGKCIVEGGDGDKVKICFVECVLKNDCNCQGGKHAAAAAPARPL